MTIRSRMTLATALTVALVTMFSGVAQAATLTSIVVSPATASITAGGTQTFTVEGFDEFGASMGDVTASTSFTISPDGSCFGVSDCSATVAGAHTVTGTNGTITDDAALDVVADALASIVVTPGTSSITAGTSQTFAAEGLDQFGNSLGDVTPSTTFSIAPDGSCAAATCGATGAGAHTVTGTNGTFTDDASLDVVADALDSIVVSPGTASIVAGGTQSYTAEGLDQFGNSLGDVTAGTTFSIAPDGSCVTADCTATAVGAHTVTGTNGVITDDASLDVLADALASIVVSPGTASITAGGTQAFTAEGFDQFGNSLGDVTAGTTFSVAPDGSCAAADCTATDDGAHTVTGDNAGVTAAASLDVIAGGLDNIVVSPDTASVISGSTQAYTAAGFDQYGNALGDMTASTTFSIAPDGSCTGVDCGANLTGPHTVTGTFGTITDNATLDVLADPDLSFIVVTPDTTSITAGGVQVYVAEGYDQYGNSLGDQTSATVFTISPDGTCTGDECTATNDGAHVVTASIGSITDDASLGVVADGLASIVVSPDTASITAGGSQAYTSAGFDQFGNALGDKTAETTFSVDTGSCTLTLCTSTLAGPRTVTGAIGSITDAAALTVTAADLDSIVLSPGTSSITSGAIRTFTVEGFDEYGNSLGDQTAGTTLTIAPDGSCTGADCTATNDGPHTVVGAIGVITDDASLEVVAENVLDSIVVSPGNATIPAAGSQAYTAEGFDQYGNSLGDQTSGVTFTVMPNGSCAGDTCSAWVEGLHTVNGAIDSITDTATLNVAEAVLDSIVVSPDAASIAAGGSQAYTAEGFDQFGNSMGDRTASTTFAIAGGSCTVADCTATSAGAHAVTGTLGSLTDAASLTVVAGAYDHFGISPLASSITAGGTRVYTAEGFDQYGNPTGNVTGSTTFNISPNGSCTANMCTATVAGSHTVQGSKSGLSRSAALTVLAGALDRIALSPATASIASGGSRTYTAEGFDSYGNSIGDRTASTVFAISPNGSCTGNVCSATALGAHTVTGTDGSIISTASLSVTVGVPATMTIAAAPSTLTSNGTSVISVTVKDAAGNAVPNQNVSFRLTQAGSGGPIGLPVGGPRVGGAATTDSTGVAQVTYNAGLLFGTDQVTATLNTLSAAVTITVSPS